MSNPLTVGRAYPANAPAVPTHARPRGAPDQIQTTCLDSADRTYIAARGADASCPAVPAPSVKSGSESGPLSHGPGLEACLIPLLQAIAEQTAAINRLASSNEALVQAMAQSEGMDEGDSPVSYLSGKPAR